MPCDEDDNSNKSCGFEPVNNAIDDEGHPVPDSLFDSFGGSDEDNNERACCSAPDWCQSDEDNVGTLPEEWCRIQPKDPKDPKDPILEEEWTEVMHKKVYRRKIQKPLSGSTDEAEGVKTHAETEGNTRDRKKTHVHNCKCGKDMLIQVKIEVETSCSKSNRATASDSSEETFDNVKANAAQLCGGELLQEACSAHAAKNSLQRELPKDLGPSKTPARAKVGGDCTRCIRSHSRCCESR